MVCFRTSLGFDWGPATEVEKFAANWLSSSRRLSRLPDTLAYETACFRVLLTALHLTAPPKHSLTCLHLDTLRASPFSFKPICLVLWRLAAVLTASCTAPVDIRSSVAIEDSLVEEIPSSSGILKVHTGIASSQGPYPSAPGPISLPFRSSEFLLSNQNASKESRSLPRDEHQSGLYLVLSVGACHAPSCEEEQS